MTLPANANKRKRRKKARTVVDVLREMARRDALVAANASRLAKASFDRLNVVTALAAAHDHTHTPIAARILAFLRDAEEIAPGLAYSDAQIGSAVRAIHGGCRAVLKDRLDLAPILPGAEGATVTVERGFDPAAVRVTGNVRGEPPYQGVLRHPGWRSVAFRLPETTGDRDHTILAPAEVEVP